MKKYITILLIASLFAACGGNNAKEEAKKLQEEMAEETGVEFEEAKNWDEFIDQYEEWMDNYLVFMEKYVKNPMDATLTTEYMKLSQEGMNWMTQWTSKLYVCSSNEKYQKRFDEISEKADKKMQELGFE